MKQILFFCDRIDTNIGGMEIHRNAFCKYFSSDNEYRLSYIIYKYPLLCIYNVVSKKTLQFSSNDSLLNYIYNININSPIIFYNGGHWIEEYEVIRKIFLTSIIVMRSGGNEIIKAPLRNMTKSLDERQKIWANIINKTCDFILSNSNYTTNRMLKLGILEDKIILLRGGIDTEQCKINVKNRAGNRLTFDKKYHTHGKIIFCIASRFVEFKGIFKTLNVLSEIKNDIMFHILLIGDGHLKKRIKKICNKYFLCSQYTILGALNNIETLKYISISDCLLNVSVEYMKGSGNDYYIHTETMGRSMMEAICQNIPIIASNTGGISELFKENPRIGILIKDVNELKDAIYTIVNKKYTVRINKKKYSWIYIFSKYKIIFSLLHKE